MPVVNVVLPTLAVILTWLCVAAVLAGCGFVVRRVLLRGCSPPRPRLLVPGAIGGWSRRSRQPRDVQLVEPTDSDQCWATLLCTPSPDPALQLRGGSVGSGFTLSPG